MASPPFFHSPDTQQRSVWIVVEPRDLVTGERMTDAVQVRLKDVADEPIAARSGVYCFTDLDLPSGIYTLTIEPLAAARAYFFDTERELALDPVPLPGQPLKRNPVSVDLLPRPAYPFVAQSTLARGRLVKASDAAGIDGAQIFLILDGVDQGRRGRTDERGEFVVFFPPTAPEDNANAGLKELKFRLRFEIEGQLPLLTPEQTVQEGTTISLEEIEVPGI